MHLTNKRNRCFQSHVPMLCLSFALVACGGDKSSADSQSSVAPEIPATSDEQAERYKSKVSNQINESYINTMVRNWGISRDQAECLLREHKMREILSGVAKDPAIRAVVEDCGVDPAVVM